MRGTYAVLTLLFAGLAAGCSQNPEPVPLSGDPADIQALEGEWAGEYHSYEASGRSGTLYFRLDAGQDTARGDVLMHLAGREAVGVMPTVDPWEHVDARQLLTITFVRAADGTVHGRLDPYSDPVCGCELRTRFTGRVKGNLIEGTWTSEHVNGSDRTTGRWRVLRSFP